MLSASPNFVSHKFQRDTQWVWARIMFVYARELHFYVLSASWGCGAMDYNCGHSISRRSRLGRLGGDPNSTLHYTTAGCTHSTRLNGPKVSGSLQWSKIAFAAADEPWNLWNFQTVADEFSSTCILVDESHIFAPPWRPLPGHIRCQMRHSRNSRFCGTILLSYVQRQSLEKDSRPRWKSDWETSTLRMRWRTTIFHCSAVHKSKALS